MHDLSYSCKIVYASDSIVDILGYQPQEVVGRSTFEFFQPEQLPFAKDVCSNSIDMDHAAILAYVNVKTKQGEWVGCECVFSVVYDVIIAATTLYRRGSRSEGRAIAAPMVRAAFSSTAHDVRYEMFAHLSAKFTSIVPNILKEPRAAFILNRFTRSLSILYATHAARSVLNLDPEDAVGLSFWECIDPDCLEGAVDAVERAKQNDSIAYMRFIWKDPRGISRSQRDPTDTPPELSRGISGSGSSNSDADSLNDNNVNCEPREVEAVVSVTSDGIIVVLRRSSSNLAPLPNHGLYAVPWSTNPLHVPPPTTHGDYSDISGSSDSAAAALLVTNEVMDSIQNVAVFVWGLQINEDVVAEHARGKPGPEATLSEEILAARRQNRKAYRAKLLAKEDAAGRRSVSPGFRNKEPIVIDDDVGPTRNNWNRSANKYVITIDSEVMDTDRKG